MSSVPLRIKHALELAIALMVRAGFVKHNIPGLPSAALIRFAL
jgi:hypothetical protein